MSDVAQWTCFDSDSGVDLAAAVREYHIVDFSGWRYRKKFESACSGLVRDLQATGGASSDSSAQTRKEMGKTCT